MKLCSACLMGMRCRYDGQAKTNSKVFQLAEKDILIPVCPEQLGGLPTPRKAIEGGAQKLFARNGKPPVKEFRNGAREVLKIAKVLKIKEAILKQRSPSCGCGQIYDGSFKNKVIKGNGVTADLLIKNGIKVISEDDI